MDHQVDFREVSAAELLAIARDAGELSVDSVDVARLLKAQGLEIKASSSHQDGSETFTLQAKGDQDGDGRPEGERARLPQPFEVEVVPDDEDDDDTMKGVSAEFPASDDERLRGMEFLLNTPDQPTNPACVRKVILKRKRTGVTGIQESDEVVQEVFISVGFVPGVTRPRTGKDAKVHLVLREVMFGVKHCINKSTLRGHFIHKVEIEVVPEENWISLSTLSSTRPGVHADPVQCTENRGGGATLVMGAVPSVQVSATSSRATQYPTTKHGWLPAGAVPGDKSVTWAWKMNTWESGEPFDAKSTTKFFRLPELPFPDPSFINFPDLPVDCDATWIVRKQLADDLKNEFKWTGRVRIHTAIVRPLFRLRFKGQMVTVYPKAEIHPPIEVEFKNLEMREH